MSQIDFVFDTEAEAIEGGEKWFKENWGEVPDEIDVTVVDSETLGKGFTFDMAIEQGELEKCACCLCATDSVDGAGYCYSCADSWADNIAELRADYYASVL